MKSVFFIREGDSDKRASDFFRDMWNKVWIYITKVKILVESVRTSKKNLVFNASGKTLIIRGLESLAVYCVHSKNGRAHTDTEEVFGNMLVAWYVLFWSLVTLDYIVSNCYWLELIVDLVGVKMSTTFKRKEKHCSDDRSFCHTHFSLVGYFSA